MDVECLTGTLRFCEIFRKASRRWMSPHAPLWWRGRRDEKKDREVTTGENFKHPLALGNPRDLQLNIDLLDSEGKIRAGTSWREGEGEEEEVGEEADKEGRQERVWEKRKDRRGSGKYIRGNKTKIHWFTNAISSSLPLWQQNGCLSFTQLKDCSVFLFHCGPVRVSEVCFLLKSTLKLSKC